MEKNYKQVLNDITTFVFDIDGVLTNGQLNVTLEGDLLRTMNVKDGFALKKAIHEGYEILIISGGTNEGTRSRLKDFRHHKCSFGYQ